MKDIAKLLDKKVILSDGNETTLKEAIKGKKTALYILRFYGCRLCKIELELLKDYMAKNSDTVGQILPVVQSPYKTVKEYASLYPFKLVCDESGEVAKLAGMTVVETMEQMGGEATLKKLKMLESMDLVQGESEGVPFQLPGILYFNEKGECIDEYVGKDAGDVPEPEYTFKILKDM